MTALSAAPPGPHGTGFGGAMAPGAALSLGEQLLSAAGLAGEPRLVDCTCAQALRLESRVRRRFWDAEGDSLREAFHRHKRHAFVQAATDDTYGALTAAWRKSVAISESLARVEWQRRSRSLQAVAAPELLRRVLRAWQQVYRRQARWDTAMQAHASNPFQAAEALLRAGVIPLGLEDGQLALLNVDWFSPDRSADQHLRGGGGELGNLPATGSSDRSFEPRLLFVSAEFRFDRYSQAWRDAVEARGWQVQYGAVDERSVPPEPRLGARIRQAAGLLALIPEPDAMLGLPWWNFQEVDYAVSLGLPVALVLPLGAEMPVPWPSCRVLHVDFDSCPDDASELWSWVDMLRSGRCP